MQVETTVTLRTLYLALRLRWTFALPVGYYYRLIGCLPLHACSSLFWLLLSLPLLRFGLVLVVTGCLQHVHTFGSDQFRYPHTPPPGLLLPFHWTRIRIPFLRAFYGLRLNTTLFTFPTLPFFPLTLPPTRYLVRLRLRLHTRCYVCTRFITHAIPVPPHYVTCGSLCYHTTVTHYAVA